MTKITLTQKELDALIAEAKRQACEDLISELRGQSYEEEEELERFIYGHQYLYEQQIISEETS